VSTPEGYVVIWPSDGQDGDSWGVYGQRLGADGERLGAEFRLNEATTSDQRRLGLASCPDGSFVASWGDYGNDVARWGVVGRRFGPDGQPLGGQFALHAPFSAPEYGEPRVACAADGRLLAVWHTVPPGNRGNEVHAQLFDASGQRQGPELNVSGPASGGSLNAHVAALPGGYAVVWERFDDMGIVARRLDANGAPAGPAIGVAVVGAMGLGNEDVAADAAGNFAVTWSDAFDVFAQRFDALGRPLGGRVAINTPPGTFDGWRSFPNMAMDAAGNYVVAYEDSLLEPVAGRDTRSVFARRVSALAPLALQVDPSGNGVLERGEQAEVRPAWRNLGSVEQEFTARLDSLLAPVPGVQEIVDGDATYAPLAGAASEACTDCYQVKVDAGLPPGVTHYDVSAVERLGAETQDVEQEWVLHVGGSFEDVDRTSAYYRSIETLLHRNVTPGCDATHFCPTAALHRDETASWLLLAREGGQYMPWLCVPGRPRFTDVPSTNPYCAFVQDFAARGITSGCGPGLYCPQADVTRAEMSVFLLRTLDATLSPPACTTPVFTDVPASSPFCRWIEELARRGVVAGCGNGAFCPDQAVTREQMAAFVAATFGLTLYGP